MVYTNKITKIRTNHEQLWPLCSPRVLIWLLFRKQFYGIFPRVSCECKFGFPAASRSFKAYRALKVKKTNQNKKIDSFFFFFFNL